MSDNGRRTGRHMDRHIDSGMGRAGDDGVAGDAGPHPAPDVLVVGGGIIGLAVAWRAVRDGLTVAVADPAPASGSSHAAAGMLAPVSEVTYTDEPLLRIGLESLARWPAFAAELADASGIDPDHRTDGTLDVAFSSDDMAALDELGAFMGKLGLAVTRLTGRECRRLEPMLAPAVRGGLYVEEDAWVDPRRVTAALLAALEAAGVPLYRERVTGFLFTGPAAEPTGCRGVRLASGRTLPAGRVVLAAGAWSGFLDGLPPGVLPPVRPVKGQIIRLRSAQPLLTRCVRGVVHGSPAYLVPRGDGEVVLGATQEEMGFDERVTAGALWELLRDARELVPGITELELVDVVARPRPGTPDNLPLIGPTAIDGLVLATGHYRNGVLLAPLTADTALAEDRAVVAACSPLRFAGDSYGPTALDAGMPGMRGPEDRGAANGAGNGAVGGRGDEAGARVGGGGRLHDVAPRRKAHERPPAGTGEPPD